MFDGKRISTTMNGMIEDRTWDGNEVLETLAANGARISRMAGGMSGRPVAYVDGSGVWRSLVTDMQGSVIGALNIAAPQPLASSTAYDPFGAVVNQAGDPAPVDWLARSRDPLTGDVDLLNRWYSPTRGRLASTDRYEYVDPAMPYSMNLYQYGYANPMGYMDRDGLKAVAELIDTVSLYQDWHDYVNPVKWEMSLLGGSSSEIFYIYDDGSLPIEINNSASPMAISFGILTSSEEGLSTAIQMARDTKKPAYFITNETHGLREDLAEAIRTKVFGFNSATVEAMIKTLQGVYQGILLPVSVGPEHEIALATEWLVHSQGGINFSEALQEVSENSRNSVELVTTFGAAAFHYKNGADYYNHYASIWDPVAYHFGMRKMPLRQNEDRILGSFGLHGFMDGYWQAYLLRNGLYESYIEYYPTTSEEYKEGLRLLQESKNERKELNWADKYNAIQGYYLY